MTTDKILDGKHILIGVCGGIAAYKIPDLISRFVKQGAEVKVIMTKAATEFVTPLTFRTMSRNPVACDMFAEPSAWEVRHIELAKWADVLLVAPATANVIGKMANGIADDMLSTVAMAVRAKVLVAPAMNTAMYTHPAMRENMEKLRTRGVGFIEPEEGRLACGDVGAGRLASTDELEECVVRALAPQDLAGLRLLVTAGATVEPLDPVRYLTNRSTGKMGVEICRAALRRGAKVTLVAGNISVEPPAGAEVVWAKSAREMFDACVGLQSDADIIIKAAAVADFRPEREAEHKIKKDSAAETLRLAHNPDILEYLGQHKPEGQVLVGFCMETRDLLQNAEAKLKRKNLDWIAANSLTEPGAGFASETNTVTVLGRDGSREAFPNMSKFMVAQRLLDKVKPYR